MVKYCHMKAVYVVVISVFLAMPALVFIEAGSVYAQDVDDFEFSSFEADYYLSADDEGRSRLRVVEQLTAEFPDYDQNKGIVRQIPITYQGRPVGFELESVQRNGQEEPIYDQSTESGSRIIELGTDEYVHGRQVYEITYTMGDVTRDFGDYQEFFWDTNGTEWRQPFHELIARVHLEGAAAAGFSGKTKCFEGVEGSRDQCRAMVDDDMVVFTAVDRLDRGENVSMVLEFASDTFAPYREGWAGVVRTAAAGLIGLLAVSAVAGALVLRWRYRDSRGRDVIVPRYTPPQGLSLLVASRVFGGKKAVKKGVAAQIIDWAVRGNVSMIEDKKRLFGFLPRTKYQIELLKTDGLSQLELQLLAALFGDNYQIGMRHEIGSRSHEVGKKVQLLRKQVRKTVIQEEYRHKAKKSGYAAYAVAVLALMGGLALTVEMNQAGFSDWRMLGVFAGMGAVAVVAAIIGDGLRPLTRQGRKTADHLEGLRDYIQLAEAERLRLLQSPDGAQSSPVDTGDPGQVVKLYEKLLPFAVLFGQEKAWAQVLGAYYEEAKTAPGWYSGGSFNPSGFASSVKGFSSSTSSSSSGMSGGASGGGGGGGGGGGR